jgi:hypothetical protein
MWNGVHISQPKSTAKADMAKVGVAINRDLLQVITDEAARRGISVQALIRAVIIPDWIKLNLERSSSDANDSMGSNARTTQIPKTSSHTGQLLVEDQIMSSPRLRR